MATKEQEGVSIKVDLPKGMSSKAVESTMNAVQKMAKNNIDVHDKENNREWKATCDIMDKRYVCTVDSLQKGVNHFEFMLNDKKDNPYPVRGKCGVVLKQGLDRRAIERLEYEHHMEVYEDPNVDITKNGIGLTTKTRKVPHYRVIVEGEVKDPVAPGKAGKRSE